MESIAAVLGRMLRGNLLAAIGGVVFVVLVIAEYRLKARALERRGKPRRHALFGFPALLEIMINKPKRRFRRVDNSHLTSRGPGSSERVETNETDHPNP